MASYEHSGWDGPETQTWVVKVVFSHTRAERLIAELRNQHDSIEYDFYTEECDIEFE